MPVLRKELSGCNWDFSTQDGLKALDKSIDSVMKDSKYYSVVKKVEIGQDQGCLKLLDTMRVLSC